MEAGPIPEHVPPDGEEHVNVRELLEKTMFRSVNEGHARLSEPGVSLGQLFLSGLALGIPLQQLDAEASP